MSYATVSGVHVTTSRCASQFARAVSGLGATLRCMQPAGVGSLLDANVMTKAYYIPLIEVFDDKLGRRSYAWGQQRYLSNWDALTYAQSLSKNSPLGRQTCTLYEWANGAWRKSPVPRM